MSAGCKCDTSGAARCRPCCVAPAAPNYSSPDSRRGRFHVRSASSSCCSSWSSSGSAHGSPERARPRGISRCGWRCFRSTRTAARPLRATSRVSRRDAFDPIGGVHAAEGGALRPGAARPGGSVPGAGDPGTAAHLRPSAATRCRLCCGACRCASGPGSTRRFDGPNRTCACSCSITIRHRVSRVATRSGLQKGLIGVVNAFASDEQAAQNNVVIAHELLHTVGATDKYDPRTNQPSHPDGYAEPDRAAAACRRRSPRSWRAASRLDRRGPRCRAVSTRCSSGRRRRGRSTGR